jgi:F-type H+-transporting ATPase subunit epsilon
MASSFPFEVHTPSRRFFSGEAEAIVLTLLDGEAAIYANHAPFTAPVLPCVLKIKTKEGSWKIAFTAEGILEVKSRKTILVSDTAEWPGEIDHERAKNAKERAEQTLAEGMLEFEKEVAKSALRRANMRIRAREEEGRP